MRWLLLPSIALLGCGSHVAESRHDTVAWQACDLFDGEGDGAAECSDLSLVSGDAEQAAKIKVHVKRFRSDLEKQQNQLWLVAGGPGASSTITFPPVVAELASLFPLLDFYMVDARGTGFTSYLECPEQESAASERGKDIAPAEVDACAKVALEKGGGSLTTFSLTASASDLIEAISLTRSAGHKTFVWAQSAGTLIAQRALLLDPAFADGVVLERAVAPDFSLKRQDAAAERALQALLALCAADATCVGKGALPVASIPQLWTTLGAGGCAAVTSRYSVAELQRTVFRMLGYYPLNTAIPAFLRHLADCSPGVIDTVSAFVDSLEPSGMDRGFSEATFQLVVASEAWRAAEFPTPQSYLDSLTALEKGSSLGRGAGGRELAAIMDRWPTYTEASIGQWPATDIPILALHGQLDPISPVESAVHFREKYTGAAQSYVEFSRAPHNVIGATLSSSGTDCAFSLMAQFLQNPEHALNTACVNEPAPLDFVGAAFAPSLFGLPDYWTPQTTGAP